MQRPVANMTAPSPTSSSSSPSTRKPRLLWRGVLHLQDGTALPGLAIVSSTQPGFPSFQQHAHERQDQLAVQPDTPFTLSKEQQDALSLSVEMVRHAPLKLLDIVENAEVDDGGLLCLPRSESSDAESSAVAANTVHITFEAAGDVRLYIDPAQHATVAFFERLFAYDKGNDARSERCDEHNTVKMIRTVVVISLDKSLIRAETTSADVFADPSWNAGHQVGSSHTSGAMEAVVIGIRRSTGVNGEMVELHVGKKIARRILTRSTSIANARGVLSFKDSQGQLAPVLSNANDSSLSRGLRPDDPAPRGFARTSSQTSSSTRSFSSSNLPVMMSNRARSSSDFVIPPPPSLIRKQNGAQLGKRGFSDDRDGENQSMLSSEPSTMLGAVPVPETSSPTSAPRKKRGGNHTPGRRGAKKPQRSGEAIPHDDKSDQSMMSAIEDDDIESAPVKKTSSLEERNRSMVKKLVHYQLLGKGVERQEPTYAACFGPTCQGTLLALRSAAKTQLIDRQVAATIVERHLDMYL